MTEYFAHRAIFEGGTERQNEAAARPPLSAASMIQTFLAQASGEQGVFLGIVCKKHDLVGNPDAQFFGEQNYL